MKIGILQTGHSPADLIDDFGNYGALFVKLLDGQGFTFDVFDVVNMEFPESADTCDGWLITGSRHGVYDDQPFIAPLEKLIRAIYAADRPMVGICFGHQIIAQALGGRAEKFDGGWAVGRQSYDWDGETVSLNAWHQDQVTQLPPDATVCAGNDHCKNAVLLYGQKAFTLQPHPEFSSDFVEGLATYRGPGLVPDTQLDDLRANLGSSIDNAAMAQKIGQFLRDRTIA